MGGSGLFQDDTSLSRGHKGSLNGLIRKLCNSYDYGLHSVQISIQLSTFGRFWSDVLDIALHHYH